MFYKRVSFQVFKHLIDGLDKASSLSEGCLPSSWCLYSRELCYAQYLGSQFCFHVIFCSLYYSQGNLLKILI